MTIMSERAWSIILLIFQGVSLITTGVIMNDEMGATEWMAVIILLLCAWVSTALRDEIVSKGGHLR